MDSPPTTLLQPPLSSTSTRPLTLQPIFSPGSSLLVAPSPLSCSLTQPSDKREKQVIYGVKYGLSGSTAKESRQFIVHCYTLFASLQKIAAEYSTTTTTAVSYNHGELPEVSREQMQYLHRLCSLYTSAVVSQFTSSPTPSPASLLHLSALHSLYSLTSLLYLPSDGLGLGIVGEEMLDWVNTVDVAPSKEEGEAIVGLGRPWEGEGFWEYLQRCLLRAHLLSLTYLLTHLSTHHPSPLIQSLSSSLSSLLVEFPRSSSPSFRTESDFLTASRKWKRAMTAGRTAAESLASDSSTETDETSAYESSQLLSLFALASGDEDALLEASEDWREALGAWGVWVHPGGKREGLPEVLRRIMEVRPVDATLPGEAAQVALILGDVTRALQQSSLLSPSFPAHLSDLLYHASLLPFPPAGSGLPSLRSYFLLEYAESLLAQEEGHGAMWRVVVEYLAAEGGQEGRGRMRAVLLSVDLVGAPVENEGKGEGMDVEEGEGGEKQGLEEEEGKTEEESRTSTSTVEEVLRVCVEQGLEEEMRQICKNYSSHLLASNRYGEAISFSIRAGDIKRIARIADQVLQSYVEGGQDTFIQHVDSIPTSLLRPRDQSDSDDDDDEDDSPLPLAPYSAKLSFLARYRDFFAFYARGDRRQAAALLVLLLTSGVAPRGFCAIMLLDILPLLSTSPSSTAAELLVTPAETYELLRILEELTAPISATGSDIYGSLEMLGRLMAGDQQQEESGKNGKEQEKERRTEMAMKQLEVVRGELARHLAKCCCL